MQTKLLIWICYSFLGQSLVKNSNQKFSMRDFVLLVCRSTVIWLIIWEKVTFTNYTHLISQNISIGNCNIHFSVKLGVSIGVHKTIGDLCTFLSNDTGIEIGRILLAEIDNLTFRWTFKDSDPVSVINEKPSPSCDLFCLLFPKSYLIMIFIFHWNWVWV